MNVLDFLGFRPILDSLDFGGRHLQTIGGEDKAEIFDGISGEVAFVGTEIKTMLSETSEYFSDMILVFFGIVGIDKNVVEIEDDTDIK